jgi:hypothetical protein
MHVCFHFQEKAMTPLDPTAHHSILMVSSLLQPLFLLKHITDPLPPPTKILFQLSPFPLSRGRESRKSISNLFATKTTTPHGPIPLPLWRHLSKSGSSFAPCVTKPKKAISPRLLNQGKNPCAGSHLSLSLSLSLSLPPSLLCVTSTPICMVLMIKTLLPSNEEESRTNLKLNW